MTLIERIQTALRDAALDSYGFDGASDYAKRERAKAEGLRFAVTIVEIASREHQNAKRRARRRNRRRG